MKKRWIGLLITVILLTACAVAGAAEIYVEGASGESFSVPCDGATSANWIDPPAVVRGLTVNQHVYLSWDAMYGIDYYNVYRKEGGEWKLVRKTVSPYFECTIKNGEYRFAVSSCKIEEDEKFESSTRTAVTVLVQNGEDKPGKNDPITKVYARGTEDKTVTVEVRDNTYLDIKSEALTIIMDGNGAMIFPTASPDNKYYFTSLGDDTYLKASKYMNGDSGVLYVYTYYFSRTNKQGMNYYVKEEERACFTIRLKKAESNLVVSNGIKYELDFKNLTAKVVGVSSESIKEATIPGFLLFNGEKYAVTAISDRAFSGMKKLEDVYIGKSVKSIGEKAFYGCKKLKTIQIESSLLTSGNVGKNAFKDIYKKATVKCPSKKLKSYRTILRQAGAEKTVSFKVMDL